MPYVNLVIALALVEFLLFGIAVARARTRYHVPAPATTGNADFERYFTPARRVRLDDQLIAHLQPAGDIDDAKRAAAEFGCAELWVFKSERLARGSGRKDEARSVMEVFVEMRRAGVALRSVEDDVYFTNPMLIGVADAMAHKYSEDLSAHTKRGLRQRKELLGKPSVSGQTTRTREVTWMRKRRKRSASSGRAC